jgi:hypothetical protein
MLRALFIFISLALPLVGTASDFELGDDLEVKVGCERFFADLEITKPTIPRRTLNVEEMSSTERFPLQNQAGYDPKAAYIGISNGGDKNEGSHHYYLIVGKRRVEVSPRFGKATVMKGRMATKGTIFKVPLPPEVLEALEARVKTGKIPRGLTCLHPVCEILRDAGVEIEGAGKGDSVRTKVVSASLMQGKIKIKGAPIDPATMEVIESHAGELNEYLATAATADAGMQSRLLSFVVIRGGGILAVAGGAGYYIHREAKK